MIIGEQIILTKPELKDMALLHEWRNNPLHRKYYREYRESTLQDQIDWYNNVVLKDDTWYHFVAKPINVPDKVIGVAFLNHIHPIYRTGEFGITLGDPEYRGKGYGKDMLVTLIKYGFDQLNLNRIWCEVYSNNTSIHLYRKVGFKDEGCLRQTVYKDGAYHNSHILGMLRSDYELIYKQQ